MSRPKKTQAEKDSYATFQEWWNNPTNPDVLRRFVGRMVDHELEVRLKRLPEASQEATQ